MSIRNVVVTKRGSEFTVRYYSHFQTEHCYTRGDQKGRGKTVQEALDRSRPNAEERATLEELLAYFLENNEATAAWHPPAHDCPECDGSGLLASDYEFADGADIPLPVNNSTLKMQLCYCLRRFEG